MWRINSQEIPLVCVDDDGLTAEPVVEGYVYAVAWDESTIYVQQRAEKDKGDMAYYAVALDSGAVSGPTVSGEVFPPALPCLQTTSITYRFPSIKLNTSTTALAIL